MKRLTRAALAALALLAAVLPAMAADKTPLASYPGEPTQPIKSTDRASVSELVVTARTTDIQADFRLSGDISPSQITSSQNDYSPTGLSTAAVLRLSTDASRNLTGLAGGADGRWITIVNVGSFDLVLKAESASSTAANRFALSADLTISTDSAAVLAYDSTSSRWRVLGSGSAGGGTPGGSSGQIQYNSSGAFAGANVSGDCTAVILAFTCTKLNSVSPGYFFSGTDAANLTGVLGATHGGAGTVSGILKGNGSGTVSAASSGTDYAPATSGSSILSGSGAGGFSNVTVGTCLTFSAGTLNATCSGIPTRVQEKASDLDGSAHPTFNFTLSSSPTAGNYLIGECYDSGGLPAANTGWTSFSSHNKTGSDDPYIRMVYKLLAAGASTSQTPCTSGTGIIGAAMIEVSGLDTTSFANSLQSVTYATPANGSSTTLTTSISATTLSGSTLGVHFAAATRSCGGSFSGSISQTSGWSNSVTTGGNGSGVVLSSQALTSAGSAVTANDSVAVGFLCNTGLEGSLILFQPSGSGSVNITGSPAVGQLTVFSGASTITGGDLTGDATTSGGTAVTLASTGVSAATYGDATHVPQIAVDVKGRITSASSVAITASAGGSSGQIQYNSSGALAGVTLGGDCTFSVPNITCTKTSGTSFGTFATQNYATPPAIGGTTPAAGSFSTLTDTGVTGTSVNCAYFDSAGLLHGTGAACGSGSGSITSVTTNAPWTSGGPITTTGTIDAGSVVKANVSASIMTNFGGL